MIYKFKPQGVCAQEFIADIDNQTINDIKIIGGCPGNTQAVAKLLKGRTIDYAIAQLEGIDCKGKGTSCPDQLAKFFISIYDKKKK